MHPHLPTPTNKCTHAHLLWITRIAKYQEVCHASTWDSRDVFNDLGNNLEAKVGWVRMSAI